MRSLQFQLHRSLDRLNDSALVAWTPTCRLDILWWLDESRLCQGVSLAQLSPALGFWSDASDVDWGAHLGPDMVSGLWSPDEACVSIDARELLAVEKGLLHFQSSLVGSTVAIFVDNSMAVAYLRKSGGYPLSSPQRGSSEDPPVVGASPYHSRPTVHPGLPQCPSGLSVSSSPDPEISQLRDYNDYCCARGRAPPDHYYRDLDILHSRYDQLSLALAESRQASASGHRGRSPVIASPRVASPTDAPRPQRPDSSSLKGPRLSPWPGPSSQDRRRPRDASSDLPHHSRLSEERYHDRFATSAEYSDSRRPRSRESPSPRRMGFASRGSPSPKRMGFASRGSPSPKRMGFASRGSPSPKRMGFASRGPLHQSEWDSLQGIPPLPSDSVLLQGTLLHLDVSAHPVLRLVMTLLGDPHRGLLLPVRLPLPEKIRKPKKPLCQRRLGL